MVKIDPTTPIRSTQTPVKNNRNEHVIRENQAEKNVDEAAQQNQPRPVVSPEEVHQAIENFNKVFKPTHLEFQLHEESGEYFVHIIDDQSKEVIRQIPSEEFLDMVAEAKNQQGFMIDERI